MAIHPQLRISRISLSLIVLAAVVIAFTASAGHVGESSVNSQLSSANPNQAQVLQDATNRAARAGSAVIGMPPAAAGNYSNSGGAAAGSSAGAAGSGNSSGPIQSPPVITPVHPTPVMPPVCRSPITGGGVHPDIIYCPVGCGTTTYPACSACPNYPDSQCGGCDHTETACIMPL